MACDLSGTFGLNNGSGSRGFPLEPVSQVRNELFGAHPPQALLSARGLELLVRRTCTGGPVAACPVAGKTHGEMSFEAVLRRWMK